MPIPSITVQTGADPSILGQLNDPAGFETLKVTRGRVDTLCEEIKCAYEALLSAAPQNIRDRAEHTIDLYCGLTPKGWNFRGQAITPDPSVLARQRGGRTEVGGSPLNRMKGLLLYIRNDGALEVPMSIVRHELIHILLHGATHPWATGQTESLVMGLENHYGDPVEDVATAHQWDMHLTEATSGLCAPTLSKTIHSPASMFALYLASRHAFRTATKEELWKLSERLMERSAATNCFPFNEDVREEIAHVFQDQAATILRSPALQDMQTPGNHTVTYYSRPEGGKASDYAAVYSFNARTHDTYGSMAGGTFQSDLFTCTDTPRSCSSTLLDAQGQQLITLDFSLVPNQDLHLAELIALARQSVPLTHAYIAGRIAGADIRIQGNPSVIRLRNT